MKSYINYLKAKLADSYPIQMSLRWLERNREKYDITIKVSPRKLPPVKKDWLEGHSLYNYVKLHKMPIHLFPNVKSFKISLRTYDVLFKMFGIDRRYKPDITIEPLSRSNREMNRYVIYQFNRMKNHPKIRWQIGKILVQRSVSFRLMALRHVVPNWWRSMQMWEVYRLLRQVERLSSQLSTKIDYKRVYIEKSNGKLRPLGVPTLAWRVYLHQWQCITTWNVSEYLSPHQHGFRPQMGVLTAWKQIMSEVIDKANIYEFDLRGFFDNVDWMAINKQLQDRTPLWVRQYFQKLMESRPKMPKEVKMGEVSLDREEYDEYVRSTISMAQSLREQDDSWDKSYATTPDGLYVQTRDEWMNFDARQWTYRPGTYSSTGKTHEEIEKEYYRGVPQGSPLSPILSILALENELMSKVTVQYADDGVIGSNSPIDFKLSWWSKEHWGINTADDKSGFVKKNGKWLKPLRFLGMEYNGETGTFSAKTRNGATLSFSGGLSALLELDQLLQAQNRLDPIIGKGSAGGIEISESGLPMGENISRQASWQNLFISEFYGFMFSRMQCDSWNIKVDQDFSLTGEKYIEGSWLSRQKQISDSEGEIGKLEYKSKGKLYTRPVHRWLWVKLAKWGVVKVDLFTASSYAYHDLQRLLRLKKHKGKRITGK